VGLPIIGNLEAYENDRLGFLTECARTYGDVVRYSSDVYIVNEPKLIGRVLGETGRTFAVPFNLLRQRGDDALWAQQRRAALAGLAPRAVQAFTGRLAAHIEGFVGEWRSPQVIRPLHELERLTSAVITDYCFSGQGDRVPGRSARLLDALFPVVAGPLFVPSSVPTPANLRVRLRLRQMNRELDRLIHRRRREPWMREDLLTVLLDARPRGRALSVEAIRETLLSVLLASHGVPAAALAWTMYLRPAALRQPAGSRPSTRTEDGKASLSCGTPRLS
jgi:cytochrome P450